MNLARLIIIAAVIWLALHLMRRLFKRPAVSDDKPKAGKSKNMVRCAQCGLHLPETEATAEQGRFFCCEEHRRQYRPPS